MEEILHRVEHLESQLEILKQFCNNLSDQQLRILELIGRNESKNIKKTH